jgi:protein-tyrosine phosphatase
MNRDGVESSMFDNGGVDNAMTSQDLRALAHRTVSQGMPVGDQGWPFAPSMGGQTRRRTALKWDHDVIIGAEGDLDTLDDIDAVVSLSRVGYEHVRDREHIEFWLIDSHHAEDNPNLEYVLRDAAKTIADLRAEGKRVFLHCVAAHNRTPTVAALYAALYCGVDANDAIATVDSALGGHGGNEFLRQTVRDIAAADR